MKKVKIKPIKITYITQDGKIHTDQIDEAFAEESGKILKRINKIISAIETEKRKMMFDVGFHRGTLFALDLLCEWREELE